MKGEGNGEKEWRRREPIHPEMGLGWQEPEVQRHEEGLLGSEQWPSEAGEKPGTEEATGDPRSLYYTLGNH